MPDRIQVYTGPGCGGCEAFDQAQVSGRLQVEVNGRPADPSLIEKVDLVELDDPVATIKELGIDTIPIAYYQGQLCQLDIDEESRTVTVKCSSPGPSSIPVLSEVEGPVPVSPGQARGRLSTRQPPDLIGGGVEGAPLSRVEGSADIQPPDPSRAGTGLIGGSEGIEIEEDSDEPAE